MIEGVFTRVFVWASLLVGTVVRALPLLDVHGRALRQFASEDGYLMLTIARNLAIGNGLSVEDGTTLTNGTQPLMTFVYAGLFWLVGGDKVWGVILAQLLGIVFALVGAFLLYRIGSLLLADDARHAALPAIAAAAWYVAPVGARYTQNCLETGAAALLPMAIGLFFLEHSPGPDKPWTLARCAALGLLLGVAFWARNDAVLLAGAVCLIILLSGLRSGSVKVGRRFIEAGCVGTTALLVASPWLIFNQTTFGHVVPVSGISQGANVTLGHNLVFLGSILAEQISIVALIPKRFETVPAVLALIWTVIVAWVAGVYWLAKKARRVQQQWLAVLAVWSALLIGFYGAIYGAGWFMGRYLFVLSPWMALLSVALGHRIWVSLGSPIPRVAQAIGFSLILLMSLGLDVRAHAQGMNNGHFQAVEWIDEHVPDDAWIAAIQTGTVGFFHDKTYNLDGKVSPEALQARLEGRIFEYVIERPTQYLVDWVGIAGWIDDELLASHFELLLEDEEHNLAVLRRTTLVQDASSRVDSTKLPELPAAELRDVPPGDPDSALKQGLIHASRDACASPCPVFLDAIAPFSWKEIEESEFAWTFGDGTSSDGYLAAHVFELTDGSAKREFQVTLTVRRKGVPVARALHIITVRRPKGRIICVAERDFSGCPSKRARDHFTSARAAWQAIQSGGRVLFRRGDSFPGFFHDSPVAGPVHVGAFGAPGAARPRISQTGGTWVLPSQWSVTDLDISGADLDVYLFEHRGDHTLVMRSHLRDTAGAFVSDGLGYDFSTHKFIVDNVVTGMRGTNYVAGSYIAIVRNRMERTAREHHTVRIGGGKQVLVAGNHLISDQSFSSLTVRGDIPHRTGSDYVLIQDNRLVGWATAFPQNDESDERVRHVIWERNLHIPHERWGSEQNGLTLMGSDMVVRNSIFHQIQRAIDIVDHPLAGNSQNIHVHHNTQFINRDEQDTHYFLSADPSSRGVVVRNNLAVHVSDEGGTRFITAEGAVVDHNYGYAPGRAERCQRPDGSNTCTDPGLENVEDWASPSFMRPRADSLAVDAAANLWLPGDIYRTSRPQGHAPDIGAVERAQP